MSDLLVEGLPDGPDPLRCPLVLGGYQCLHRKGHAASGHLCIPPESASEQGLTTDASLDMLLA